MKYISSTLKLLQLRAAQKSNTGIILVYLSDYYYDKKVMLCLLQDYILNEK